MSISIIDNFSPNFRGPLDSRTVAASYSALSNIDYIYDGLKVYVTSEDRTYVWNGSTWSIEGNGIYGASGSLSANTNIHLGSVGANIGSQSYRLSVSASASNTGGTELATWTNRHTSEIPGLEWRGLESRTQLFLDDDKKPSAYISFNPSDLNAEQGGFAIGVGDGVSNTLTERFRITPRGRVGISQPNPISDFQIGTSFSVVLSQGGAGIGHNWHQNTGTESYFSLSSGGSSIKMGLDGTMSIINKPANSTIFSTSAIFGSDNTQFVSDTGANAWEPLIPKSPQVRPLNDHINNSEHRFTKLQSTNWKTLGTSGFDNSTRTIWITDDANSFEITVPVNTFATDIKVLRNGTPRNLPDGATINIRFRHATSPGTASFYLQTAISETDSSTNIRSNTTDARAFLETGANRLRIVHDPVSNFAGDTITFRKSGTYWDIISCDRTIKLAQHLREYTDDALSEKTEFVPLDYPNASSIFQLGPLYVHLGDVGGYRFIPATPTSYQINNYTFGEMVARIRFSTTLEPNYAGATISITKEEKTGRVTLKGGNVEISNLNAEYLVASPTGTLGVDYYMDSENYLIWKIGEIGIGWRPTATVFAKSYFKIANFGEFREGWTYIDTDGNVMVKFSVSTDATPGTTAVIISIPPMSWYWK